MGDQRADQREPHDEGAAAPPRQAACAPPARDEGAACPACGAELRLWAGYQRCRNCGYKESCCF